MNNRLIYIMTKVLKLKKEFIKKLESALVDEIPEITNIDLEAYYNEAYNFENVFIVVSYENGQKAVTKITKITSNLSMLKKLSELLNKPENGIYDYYKSIVNDSLWKRIV